jgi:hypothetical protein
LRSHATIRSAACRWFLRYLLDLYGANRGRGDTSADRTRHSASIVDSCTEVPWYLAE